MRLKLISIVYLLLAFSNVHIYAQDYTEEGENIAVENLDPVYIYSSAGYMSYAEYNNWVSNLGTGEGYYEEYDSYANIYYNYDYNYSSQNSYNSGTTSSGSTSGSNIDSSGLPGVPSEFNLVVSLETLDGDIAVPIKREVVGGVNVLTICPVKEMIVNMPVNFLEPLVVQYNATTSSTPITIDIVISEISNNLISNDPISIEIEYFEIWIQEYIIEAIGQYSSDDKIRFDSCDGSCYCDNKCEIDVDDPCANKDLINKVIPDYLRQQIESRTQTFPNPPYVANSFNIQDINEGWGKINLDKYSLNITSLPSGYSPFQLFDEIRKNLSQFIVGGDFDSVIKYGSVFNFAAAVTLEPYSPEDGVVWNSENPIGAAMDFDTFLDTSTVVCVDYSEDEMFWTFATVYSWDHSGHFVSGLRQFGLESNGQGGYSFYLRGADRLGGALDYLANGLETGNDYLYLGAGDANWKNFMELLENYLLKKPGASVEHFDKSRTYGKRHWYVEGGCP